MTRVHLIRAFVGPRHARLERIWERVAALVAPQCTIEIHDNLGPAQRPHGEMLQRIWEGARQDDCVLTEFDFLPTLNFYEPGARPVVAAEYATRCAYTRRLRPHGIPGAWFVRVAAGTEGLDFTAGGPFNDPAAKLPPHLTELLPAQDAPPFGVLVPGRGTHCFWSRHYNDPPAALHAGFVMGEIQRAVDLACDRYEEWLGTQVSA